MRPARSKPVQRIAAGVDLADHRIGIDLDPVELDPCGEAGIGEPLRIGGKAGGILLDREQRHALGIVRRPGGARGHDQQVGDVAMGHELLPAGQPETVARPLGLQPNRLAMLRALVDRQRRDGVAGDDPGKPPRRLRRSLQRRDCRDRRGQERGGRQVSPDLLQHHARLDMAEAQPALVLADQDAGEAHLGEALPHVAREAGGIVCIAQGPHVADRSVLGHEVLRGVAQHRLFVVQVQWHFLLQLPLPSGKGLWLTPPAILGCAWR